MKQGWFYRGGKHGWGSTSMGGGAVMMELGWWSTIAEAAMVEPGWWNMCCGAGMVEQQWLSRGGDTVMVKQGF